jgi:hypothetical protein
MSKPVTLTLAILILALPAAGQGRKSSQYRNEELGLTFSGVYGWQARLAAGAGAWAELASYREPALDAVVLLQMRNNPFNTAADLRASLKREFQESGEVKEGEPAYKEIVFSDVAMKGGQKLPGIQVEGHAVKVDDEGKKREHFIVVRTFFGKNRLYRVSCSVRRNRAKRVRDLFDHAMDSLKVQAQAERVAEEISFRSKRGGYTCEIPRGFSIVVPEADAEHDIFFDGGGRGISISVFCLDYEGELFDQRDELEYEFDDDITFDEEETQVLGGTGFLATIQRGGYVTLVAGVLKDGRLTRIHTAIRKSRLEDGRRTHEKFLASFRHTK